MGYVRACLFRCRWGGSWVAVVTVAGSMRNMYMRFWVIQDKNALVSPGRAVLLDVCGAGVVDDVQ